MMASLSVDRPINSVFLTSFMLAKTGHNIDASTDNALSLTSSSFYHWSVIAKPSAEPLA